MFERDRDNEKCYFITNLEQYKHSIKYSVYIVLFYLCLCVCVCGGIPGGACLGVTPRSVWGPWD